MKDFMVYDNVDKVLARELNDDGKTTRIYLAEKEDANLRAKSLDREFARVEGTGEGRFEAVEVIKAVKTLLDPRKNDYGYRIPRSFPRPARHMCWTRAQGMG